MNCPYCNNEAVMTTGKSVYPHRKDLWGKFFYQCRPCDAYCGCHPGTNRPLGRMANKELRGWRQKAHAAFDPIWKSGDMKRYEAYGWLAEKLRLTREETHIGEFGVDKCKQVIEICGGLK